MILGILSDTHGSGRMTAGALNVLKLAGAEAFVHCGDLGGEEVLDELSGLRVWFVWGNTDEFGSRLSQYARALGLTPPTQVPLRLELDGRSLAVFHGHEPQFGRLIDRVRSADPERVRKALEGLNYVLFGHTHACCDERIGPLRVVNPGGLYRVRTRSVATLDLRRDIVRFWRVDTDWPSDSPRLVELARSPLGARGLAL